MSEDLNDHDLLLKLDGDIRVLGQEVKALDRLIRERFTERDKALSEVSKATSELTYQVGRKMGRDEFAVTHDALLTRFNVLSARVDAASGGAGLATKVITAIAVAIALLSLIAVLVDQLTR